MKIKILFQTIVIAFCVVSCHQKSPQINKVSDNKSKHDTIYFSSKELMQDYKSIFMVKGSHLGKQGTESGDRSIEFDTKGVGRCVGVDTVFYYQRCGNKFIAVVTIASFWPELIYYNGDSLFTEVVANFSPDVKEYKTKNFTVICITESRWVVGRFVKTMLYYRINNDGVLWPKRYYDATRLKSGIYDTTISVKIKGESIVMYKNKKLDFIYK